MKTWQAAKQANNLPGIYIASYHVAEFATPVERDRAIACVNALAGLNPDGVKLAVEALEALTSTARTFRNVPKDEQEWTSIDETALQQAFAALAAIRNQDAQPAAKPQVVITVQGGCADVTQCPEGIDVQIVDLDNEKVGR